MAQTTIADEQTSQGSNSITLRIARYNPEQDDSDQIHGI